jgi:hypothetical protein
MELNIGKELANLQKMTVPRLRRRYAEVFGEGTTSKHKDFLIRRIVWRLQESAQGGLSARARQRAKDLAKEGDIRLTAPMTQPALGAGETTTRAVDFPRDERLPMPGAIITRQYKGRTLAVKVLPNGFEFEGEIYGSLSAVAKKITGSHYNGFLFFRLTGKDQRHGK